MAAENPNSRGRRQQLKSWVNQITLHERRSTYLFAFLILLDIAALIALADYLCISSSIFTGS